MYLKILLTSITLICFSQFSFSQKNDSIHHHFYKIDSLISSGIANMAFPGAVLYAVKGDSILVHKAYGFHTYDSIREVEVDHLYDLASITKVTAATLALMKLYELGAYKLDESINMYFPEIGGKRGKATFRELLAHQSGWKSWVAYHERIRDRNGGLKKKYVSEYPSEKYDFKLSEDKYLRSDFYKRIKKEIKKAEFDGDQGYVYSGLFFYLVPELVQKLSGLDFYSFLQQYFYDPLGAGTLVFNPLELYPDSIIVPTEIDTFFREEAIHGWVHDEGAIMMKGVSGNAGLFGTAQDLAKVWQVFLDKGLFNDSTLLLEQTIDLFTTVQYPSNKNRRGLGFDKPLIEYDSLKSSVARSASSRSYGHTGYTGPIVWADPEKRLLFIFLCNRVYPTRKQRILYEMNIRPTIHQWLYDWSEEIISEKSRMSQ